MKNKTKSRRKRRQIGKSILVAALLLTAFALVLYPFFSNYLYENQADGVIETIEKVAEENDGEYEDEILAAREYNRELLDSHVQLTDPFIGDTLAGDTEEYGSLLNMTDAGVMGFITIPCISVSLPIYHGTSEETLEMGAGHLQGTSLPVGGDGVHTVITGHTGLSKAKMFTDIIELEEGDVFFLEIMGLKLAYEVDNISVVEPEDISKLTAEEGKDYCTLVTCTPYGINSHRLLVRGVRTDYEEAAAEPEVFEKKESSSQWMAEYTKSVVIGSVCFIILILLLLIYRKVSAARRRKRRREAAKAKAKVRKAAAAIGEEEKIGPRRKGG